MGKRLRKYIQFCKTCQENQTTWYVYYNVLKPITIPALSFHTITLNFILVLPQNLASIDNLLMCIYKFSKKF